MEISAIEERDKIIKCLENKLKDMNEKLLNSESFKQSFISNLRNEIFDPITTIFLISYDMSRGKVSEEEFKNYIKLLYRETLDIYIKLSNIFLMADFEAGTVQLRNENILFEDFVNDILELMQIKVIEKNITIKSNFVGKEKLFRGDSEKLKILFINILENSIYYSPEGSVITVSAWITDKNLNFIITDRGEKFDDEVINKNFTELTNLIRDLSMKARGKTLSFSVSKLILELLNGKITVTQKNEETVIAIFIPELEIQPELTSTGTEFFFGEEETF